MRSSALRRSAPIALVVCISAFAFIEAPADEKRPPRRQAAEQLVGGAKKRVAEVLNAASNRPAAEAPAPAKAAKPAAADTPAAKEDSSSAAKTDSSKGATKAEPAKAQKERGGKPAAERDSTEKKPSAEKEEREEAPVRGPRLPFWPGITMANPSAGNVGMLAMAY